MKLPIVCIPHINFWLFFYYLYKCIIWNWLRVQKQRKHLKTHGTFPHIGHLQYETLHPPNNTGLQWIQRQLFGGYKLPEEQVWYQQLEVHPCCQWNKTEIVYSNEVATVKLSWNVIVLRALCYMIWFSLMT